MGPVLRLGTVPALGNFEGVKGTFRAPRQLNIFRAYRGDGKVVTSMSLNQSIVWSDSKEAQVLSVENGLHHRSTVQAEDKDTNTEAQPNAADSGKETAFFCNVARALDWADEILIVGPSVTKVAFLKYMHKNDHSIDPRILGVETIERPTDAELAAFANLYFTLGGPARSGNGSRRDTAE